jgi:hypothetical protein
MLMLTTTPCRCALICPALAARDDRLMSGCESGAAPGRAHDLILDRRATEAPLAYGPIPVDTVESRLAETGGYTAHLSFS